ncbi:STAS domain-containing protein [Nannocystis pusilla]|uniref:STAS domain-containing protein n=1 Tax=Nannocystis pusilla TaxID=889268 RepID=UPI003DA5E7FE
MTGEARSEGEWSGDVDLAVHARTLEGLKVGVCVWRLERADDPASLRLVIANAAACRFLGVAREAVLGRPIVEGFPGCLATPLPSVFTEIATRGGERHLGDVPYNDDIVAHGVFSIVAGALAPGLVLVEFTNVSEQHRLQTLHETNAELVHALEAQTEAASREAERSRALVAELDAKLALIAEQSAQLHARAAPILNVWPGVLAVPIIGEFHSERAAALASDLLHAVTTRRARAVILDVTAVATLDPASVEPLQRLVAALRLVGADGIITGIRPQLAQALVAHAYGVAVRTFRSLSEGLRACIAAQPGDGASSPP